MCKCSHGVLRQGLEVPIRQVRKGHMPAFTHNKAVGPVRREANWMRAVIASCLAVTQENRHCVRTRCSKLT